MALFALQSQVFRLAGSGASISDTSITLVAMKGIEGNIITMAQLGSKAFATIEPGSGDKEEQISFTGITQNPNGTATLTGVKSVSFYTPYTETNGLNKSHSGGVALTLSNTSGFYNALFNSINKFNITCATTANVDIATDLENGDVVDGYTIATGDTVLVKNQTTQSENGVYIVNTSGAATRAGFFNDDLSIRGAILMVAKGTVNLGTIWRNTNATAITVGVTNITFDDYPKEFENVGTGEGDVFRDKVGGKVSLKTIKQSGKVTVTNNADDVTIDTTAEINTASNVGTGEGTIFKQKNVEDLELKTIKAGTNITITNNADDITIASTDTGEVNTASNVGAGSGIFKQKTGVDLELKSLVAGTGVSLTDNVDDVTIAFSPATAKATGSDIDTGTDNDKYVTSKSIADSKLSFTDGVETLTNKTLTNPIFTNGTINFNAPQGFLINGKIVRTVDTGNITVAIKTLAGNDPSATDPVYCRIGNTVRAITSALNVVANAGTNWLNLGSAELATKEVDLFVYLGWQTDTSLPKIVFARRSNYRLITQFNISANSENGSINNFSAYGATNEVECIGRFNAILSAGSAYTWSIPATSIIINKYIHETEWIDWNPTLTLTNAPTSLTVNAKYKIIGNDLYFIYNAQGTANGSNAGDTFYLTLPFTPILFSGSVTLHLNADAYWSDNVSFTDKSTITAYTASTKLLAVMGNSTRKPVQLSYTGHYRI